MEFRLLGPLEAVGDRQPIVVAGPRQRGLLAILLLHCNQVVSAARLAEELWGDRPAASATALQMQISRLRRALAAGGASRRLVTKPPGYVLEVGSDELDVLVFERLCTSGRRELGAQRWDAAAKLLQQALALWRGPALADFQHDDFAQGAISRLDELRLAALEDRAEAELARGRHLDVIPELDWLIEAHPLRERMWGQLILALYRAGRQADALRAYQTLRRTLGEELGIDPSPELQQLDQAVLAQDPSLAWKAVAPDAAPVVLPEIGPSAVRVAALVEEKVFVGRGPELATLRRRLDEVEAARGGLVLVSGHPGIGKTRLAEEVAAAARARGVRVLWGRCHEDTGAPPYWPWLQVLRAYAAETGIEGLRAAAGSRAAELSAVVPELADGDADRLSPAEPPEVARFRLFDAFTSLVRQLAASRPFLLVIDDVQWADTGSLLFLEFLAQHLSDMAVLVVVTYRDVGLGADHPLTHTLGSLVRQPATDRLALEGLGEGDVTRLIEASTRLVAGPLAVAVHRKTDGNPFFVHEIIRLLEAEGRLDRPLDPSAWNVGVPPGVREVVARRCAGLSTDAREVLAVGAVIGTEFEWDLVRRAVRPTDEHRVELVEELLAAGLVSEDPERVGCLRFSHDIVRETIYKELSGVRRARLHLCVGDALETADGRQPEAPLAELAHHFHLAVAGGADPTKAVDYSLRAAEQATAALAYEDALRHYGRALSALDSAPVTDDALRNRILLALGDALWRAGDVREAKATFLEASELARARGEWELLGRALLGFGGGALRDWHADRGDIAGRLVSLLEEALEGIGPADSKLRVRLLAQLAEQLYYSSAHERRWQLTEDAVAIARRLGDHTTLAFALCSRCLALWDPDHLEERRAAAEEIVDLAETLDNPELSLFGRHYLFVAQLEAGHAAEAAATLVTFEETAERLRQPLYRWEARWFRALQAQIEGRWEDAERLAVEALDIGQQTGDTDAFAIYGVQIGAVRLEQGRVSEMASALRALVEEFSQWPSWRAGLAMTLAEMGELEEARQQLELVAADDFAGFPRDFGWMAAMAMLTMTCWHLGDVDRAETLYRLLVPFAERNILTADRSYWGPASQYLGLLATMTGRFDEADAHLQAALDMSRRMGSGPSEAHTLCDHAWMLLRRRGAGDDERARRLLDQAESMARSLGMRRLEDKVARHRVDAAALSR